MLRFDHLNTDAAGFCACTAAAAEIKPMTITQTMEIIAAAEKADKRDKDRMLAALVRLTGATQILISPYIPDDTIMMSPAALHRIQDLLEAVR